MAISLEELRRQREQIQKHLDWLDAKIREQAGQAPEPEPTEKPALPLASPSSQGTAPEPQASPDLDADEHSEPTQVPEVNVEGRVYKAKTADELMRAKVGCLILFVVGCLLFLFLLFGLPYLL